MSRITNMKDFQALSVLFEQADKRFFAEYPDRRAHIRLPYRDEMAGEFFSLGDHKRERRRVLIWRVPKDNPYFDPTKPPLLKIPFLAFADEEISDRDDILLPIIDEIMQAAYKSHRRGR